MVPMPGIKAVGALHVPRNAAVPAASCSGVSPPAQTPGGTPDALAGEDAHATSSECRLSSREGLGLGSSVCRSKSKKGLCTKQPTPDPSLEGSRRIPMKLVATDVRRLCPIPNSEFRIPNLIGASSRRLLQRMASRPSAAQPNRVMMLITI
jgi:hypothetical protein